MRQYYPVLSSSKRGLPKWPYLGLCLYPCLRSIKFFWLETIKTWKVSMCFITIFIHSLCRWYNVFFLENKESKEELVKHLPFTLFFIFLGLKTYISNCEICGLGSLKGVDMAAWSMQSVDLTRDAIKILGIYFSYNFEPNESKKLLSSYYQCSCRFKTMEDEKYFYWRQIRNF